MKAMVLEKLGSLERNPSPLEAREIPVPVPGEGEILLRVHVCGVCHTELDEIEGRTPPSDLPVVLGHQVVGRVEGVGPGAEIHRMGDRVGVAWFYSSCGSCTHCRSGMENLCSEFRATGRDADGGYAEYMKVPERSAFAIPGAFSDEAAAPLLCAGAVGYRSLRLTGLKDGQRLGLTGFGASAHLVLQMVRHGYPKSRVFVFARSEEERAFSRELGAVWAGDTGDRAPETLDCIIDTTPAWRPVVKALENLGPGGRLVINAIRKEDRDRDELLRLDYSEHLWMEKEIKSVANVTRSDVTDFLALAGGIPLHPVVREFPLTEVNRALQELKGRKIRGAKVLRIHSA